MTTTGPRSNLVAGAGGALLGALAGGAIWAWIAIASDYKIGIVAVVVGALAGFLAGRLGGVHPALPVTAAACALVGCLVGDLLILADVLSARANQSMRDVLADMVQDVAGYGWPKYREGFRIMDLVFYAIAAYAAFRLAQQIGAQTAARAAAVPAGVWDAPPADPPVAPAEETPADEPKSD